MAFSTTSFFAGVGTVFAAVTIGFAGGALITTSPRMEPNRLERVAANTPSTFAAASKAEKPQVPAVPSLNADAPAVPPVLATNATPEPAASPDRVTAASASPQVIPPPPQLVVTNVSSELDNAKKLREAELRKQAESGRRAEQRRERRKRQEIEAAATAVKRIQRDGVLQEASQREETPSLGFFGETPKLGSFGHD